MNRAPAVAGRNSNFAAKAKQSKSMISSPSTLNNFKNILP